MGGFVADGAVQRGCAFRVVSGGEISGFTIDSGGSVLVGSGAQFDLTGIPPTGVTFEPGAREAIGSGANVSGLQVSKYQILVVESGGIATDADILSGGTIELAGG